MLKQLKYMYINKYFKNCVLSNSKGKKDHKFLKQHKILKKPIYPKGNYINIKPSRV